MSTSLNNAQLPSHLANSSQNCVVNSVSVTSALHPQNIGMSQSLHDTTSGGANNYENNSSSWTNTTGSTGSHAVTPAIPVPPRNLKKTDNLLTTTL